MSTFWSMPIIWRVDLEVERRAVWNVDRVGEDTNAYPEVAGRAARARMVVNFMLMRVLLLVLLVLMLSKKGTECR